MSADAKKGKAQPVGDCVREAMRDYFAALDGHEASGLYQMVLREVEKPLFEAVLEHTGHNQSQAAQVLGMNRGTLRKKLREHDLLD